MSVVSIYARFDDIPAACRDAFDKLSGAGGFFATWRWFRHLAETTLDRRHGLRLYCVDAGAQTPLLLPMIQDLAGDGLFKPRRLNALANFYTPLFEPLTGSSEVSEVSEVSEMQSGSMLTALVQALVQERPQWDVIDLHPLDLDCAALARMAADFRAARMAVQRYFCFGNWYLAVDGRPYRTVFDGLPSRLRNTIKRKSMQLAARLRIDIVVEDSHLDAAITAYEAIYCASWKQAEAFPAFMPGLMRLCARQGSLRLGIAYIDGQAAAAQFWIVHNGVASIYKLAYDQRFSRFSVGSILTDRLMRHVIDTDHVREVDFLSGDDAYKKDWMSHRRERWGFIAFNLSTLPGVILAGRHCGGRFFKHIYRLLFKGRVH